MAVTLLNPGCGPCNGCEPCPQCSDYHDPNDWYVWLDDILPSQYDGPGAYAPAWNPDFLGYPQMEYYWTASDFHDVLNAILVSFQFPLTEPSIFAGSYKEYVVEDIPLTGIIATATAMIRHGTSPYDPGTGTWLGRSSWEANVITFHDFILKKVIIRDPCTGSRQAYFTLWFDTYQPAHVYGDPAMQTFRATFALDENSVEECNKPMTSLGTATTFVVNRLFPSQQPKSVLSVLHETSGVALVNLPLYLTGTYLSGLVFPYAAFADTSPP